MGSEVVVVCGPTATGKTALGVELALYYGGEVVSADSMQVYRRMDIGTAKPTAAEMRGVRHHMLDVAEPDEDFSVARYVELASACVDDILARGRLPIIVGGTGLYIDSLLRGTGFSERGGRLRSELNEEYDSLGGEAMLARLRGIDPERAAALHPNDRRRIVRAIEVYELTGLTITEHDRLSRETPPRYKACRIMLSYADRSRLYERIDARVDAMAAAGLSAEVEGLLSSGVPDGCTAMQAIGYKEMALALRGELGMDEAIELIKRGSRRYAKRQLTWFLRDKGAKHIFWENTADFDYARRVSTEFIANAV